MNIDLSKTQHYLDWLKEKLYLNQIASSNNIRTIFRGQVYRCKFGIGIGSEQSKERPCVILQYNSANKSSPNTIVAPITHTSSKLPVVIPIATQLDNSGNVLLDGNVLLGNITCISKYRLGDYISTLTADEMKKVDNAISLSLNINHYYKTLQNKYNDKLKYIEKLKNNHTNLQSELASKNLELHSFKSLLQLYNINNIEELKNFLENH